MAPCVPVPWFLLTLAVALLDSSHGLQQAQGRAAVFTEKTLRAEQIERVGVAMTSMTALDFDKNRIEDWIAYHNMIGFDYFLLFLDVDRSNLNDPDIMKVYKHLTSSPVVTVINGSFGSKGHATRVGEAVKLVEAQSLLPANIRYLANFDTDEYLVFERFSQQTVVPNLRQLLSSTVGSTARMGLYLDRYAFRSSGWFEPPPYGKAPEFEFFQQRAANNASGLLPKYILNLPLAIQFRLRYGHATQHYVQTVSESDPQMVAANDHITINHYGEASVQECEQKMTEGAHHKNREKRIHCGQVEPSDVVDAVLTKWSADTRARRQLLFPDLHHQALK